MLLLLAYTTPTVSSQCIKSLAFPHDLFTVRKGTTNLTYPLSDAAGGSLKNGKGRGGQQCKRTQVAVAHLGGDACMFGISSLRSALAEGHSPR